MPLDRHRRNHRVGKVHGHKRNQQRQEDIELAKACLDTEPELRQPAEQDHQSKGHNRDDLPVPQPDPAKYKVQQPQYARRIEQPQHTWRLGFQFVVFCIATALELHGFCSKFRVPNALLRGVT